jgi:hypothetical protein
MVSCVPLALLRTCAAGPYARFDRCADDPQVGLCLAGDDATDRVTDVGAVEAETNAADQLLHVFLAEGGVGATRAGSGAVEAFVDTPEQQISVNAGRARMPLDDFLNGHVLSLLAGGFALPADGKATVSACFMASSRVRMRERELQFQDRAMSFRLTVGLVS